MPFAEISMMAKGIEGAFTIGLSAKDLTVRRIIRAYSGVILRVYICIQRDLGGPSCEDGSMIAVSLCQTIGHRYF